MPGTAVGCIQCWYGCTSKAYGVRHDVNNYGANRMLASSACDLSLVIDGWMDGYSIAGCGD